MVPTTRRSTGAFMIFRTASVVALALAVVHCGFLKKKTDEGADAEAEAATTENTPADAAPQTPAAPTAANEADVARFPDETKLDSGPTLPLQRQSVVREAPPAGKAVMTLGKGSMVTEIAQREKYFLVTFDKPGDASTKLMGWIHQDSFSAISVDAGIKPLTCTAPEVPLYSDVSFCGRVCTKDADCGAGQACKGTAQPFVNGKLGAATSVCTVFKPTAVDAGVPAVVVDAGHVIGIAGDIIGPNAGKQCPIGYYLMKADNQCHRLCVAVNMCSNAKNCATCEGRKVCVANPAQCK